MKKKILILSVGFVCLSVLASCGYKRNAFLEKGNNDGRFYFENGEFDKACTYRDKYNEKNGLEEFFFTDERREKIKVRFDYNSKKGCWTVPVKVNDIPMDFFLDTGTWWSALSYDGLKILGKNYNDVSVVQKDSEMFGYFPKTFSFGNVCFDYTAFSSSQLEALGGIYGTLGMSHFFYYFPIVSFDSKGHSIILNDDIPDVKGVKLVEDGPIIVQVQINGKTYKAMLDSGCADSSTFVDLWNNDEELQKYEKIIHTWEGEKKFLNSQNTVKGIIIGDSVIDKLTFYRMHETESDIFKDIRDSGLVDMILGSEFFLKAKVTVDNKNEMCYVVPYKK